MKQNKPAAAIEKATFPIESHLTFRINVLSQLLSRVVDGAVSEELGLSSRQWRVLVTLSRIEPSTSGEIARYANFDKSQVSRVASELEGMGLLTQSGDASDRRKLLLGLTKKGREVIFNGTPGAKERQRRLRGRIGTEDYAVFDRVLTALTEEAQSMLSEVKTSKKSQAS